MFCFFKLIAQGPYNATPEPEDSTRRHEEAWDLVSIVERVVGFAEKLLKKFQKSKKALAEVLPEDEDHGDVKPGNEMTQELTSAWNLFTRVSKSNHH